MDSLSVGIVSGIGVGCFIMLGLILSELMGIRRSLCEMIDDKDSD